MENKAILTPEQIDNLLKLAIQYWDNQLQKLATKEEILEVVDKLNKTPHLI